MKKFATPEIEVVKFSVMDVLTTSNENGGGSGGQYETPLD